MRAGARVYIVGRNAEVLTKSAASLSQHGHCVAIVGDLSAEQGIESVVAQYGEHETSLHALINNAGTAWGAPIEEYSGERFAKVLTVNLVAPFELAVRFLPALRTSASADNPARIINVGSTDGTLPPRYETYAYSSSKAGLHMLTRHLAYRFRHENIVVNTIAPGLFETKLTAFRFRTNEGAAEARAEIPIGREGSPDDAAEPPCSCVPARRRTSPGLCFRWMAATRPCGRNLPIHLATSHPCAPVIRYRLSPQPAKLYTDVDIETGDCRWNP